ncbi:MAG: YbbR-like domain-containing protein [Deltaproteobacteria bacterium]|nr:YbbR-like domain-containing protein [Deltaproteobacteria bacterium]
MTRIRSLLLENLHLKLMSLGLALLLWFFVSGKSKTELALSVPIEFTSIPAAMTITTKVPTSIHIRVKGTKTLLRPLTSKPPTLSIDLAKATVGKNIIQLADESFNDLPLGVDVVHLDPEILTLYLDRYLTVELPIELKIIGEPPRGFQIRDIKLTPPIVSFRASERYLKEHDRVYSEPIDVSEIRENTELAVRLLPPLDELKPTDPEVEVKARIEIGEVLAQRVIKGIRIDFKNRDKEVGRLGISNYFVDLVVECPLLMQIDDIRKQTVISVDLISLAEGSDNGYYSFPVEVQLPDKVQLLSMDPPEVEVVFKKTDGS